MSDRSQRPPYTSLAVLALILAAVFVWTYAPERPSTEPRREADGRTFETFGTLTDIAFLAEGGRQVRLSDFKGRPVVLNLWATWCAPCIEEMPSLDRLQRDFPSIKVIAVSLDKDGEDKVRAFLDENGLRHLKTYTDPSMKALAALGVPGLPATILIASDGTDRGAINGAFDWDSKVAREAVAALLHKDGEASSSLPLTAGHRRPAPPPDGVTEASFGP
jgi:thiol-disulfide isomerase/thioredoxin